MGLEKVVTDYIKMFRHHIEPIAMRAIYVQPRRARYWRTRIGQTSSSSASCGRCIRLTVLYMTSGLD
ncbi:hypothetical protein FE784_20835 [Paenibacillus hemerocallicola]|uniref:Uncharacterized protein n=1 Tax=Paenibacillus hemerocallicola TaxID=1172614 RepID=A0A5C4T7G8_9BACL|nr:hypothetical protein [Paenibacillus hemerocallicola]TNJ64239.1 hypothetical protein FE784_20835 [Paenibacillus hemerocallicola]